MLTSLSSWTMASPPPAHVHHSSVVPDHPVVLHLQTWKLSHYFGNSSSFASLFPSIDPSSLWLLLLRQSVNPDVSVDFFLVEDSLHRLLDAQSWTGRSSHRSLEKFSCFPPWMEVWRPNSCRQSFFSRSGQSDQSVHSHVNRKERSENDHLGFFCVGVHHWHCLPSVSFCRFTFRVNITQRSCTLALRFIITKTAIFYSVVFYLVWQLLYYAFIVYGRREKFARGLRATSYTWLLTDTNGFVARLVQKLSFGKSNEGANRYRIVVYFFLQFRCMLLSILPVWLWYYR